MEITGFLKRFKKGDSVHTFCDAENYNRIANILEDLDGMGGIRIYKPTEYNGRGWKISLATDIPMDNFLDNVKGDSEMEEPISYSIQRNLPDPNDKEPHELELELYKFNDSTYISEPSIEELEEFDILMRDRSTGENTLKYVSWSDLPIAVVGDSESTYPTSYSIQKNTNSEIEMYKFNDDSYKTTPTKETLEGSYDVVMRDRSGNNTLKYVPYQNLPISVSVDSERTSGKTGNSISHNSQNDLQIYNFPTGATGEIDLSNSYQFVMRQKIGSQAPTVAYLTKDDLEYWLTDFLSGITKTINVVREVTYSTSSHKLEYLYSTLTFTNGVLTSAVDDYTPVLIDQAVEETYE